MTSLSKLTNSFFLSNQLMIILAELHTSFKNKVSVMGLRESPFDVLYHATTVAESCHSLQSAFIYSASMSRAMKASLLRGCFPVPEHLYYVTYQLELTKVILTLIQKDNIWHECQSNIWSSITKVDMYDSLTIY